ncbi:hypothetical protein [Maridesulfovibrio bastinii]|uniref:hypothetical protein n=1 Tax=Maridesulfovibrio bastinii TaxID=47157 RepID=UPI00042029C2|nr:hypothetical protein [Maridesulfovibrio bastinii]
MFPIDELICILKGQGLVDVQSAVEYFRRALFWTCIEDSPSLLLADGSPVEVSLVSSNGSVRVAVDGASPLLSPKKRFQTAYSLFTSFDSKWCEFDWNAASRLLFDEAKWTCWHGVRIDGYGRLNLKLYLELNSYPPFFNLDQSEGFLANHHPVMLGINFDENQRIELEWYYALSNPTAGFIKCFLRAFNIENCFNQIWDVVEVLYPYKLVNSSPSEFVGLSFSTNEDFRSDTANDTTVFMPLSAFFGSDLNIHEKILEMLPQSFVPAYLNSIGKIEALSSVGGDRFGLLGIRAKADRHTPVWYISYSHH